jgi:hypothetical protein
MSSTKKKVSKKTVDEATRLLKKLLLDRGVEPAIINSEDVKQILNSLELC